jgi:hypothetical protein
MGGVINLTKDAMMPMMDTASTMGQNVGNAITGTWDCSCGNKGIVGNFCNMCGQKRPNTTPQDTWDCSCGNKGIVGNFCNMCCKKRGE